MSSLGESTAKIDSDMPYEVCSTYEPGECSGPEIERPESQTTEGTMQTS